MRSAQSVVLKPQLPLSRRHSIERTRDAFALAIRADLSPPGRGKEWWFRREIEGRRIQSRQKLHQCTNAADDLLRNMHFLIFVIGK
ncbi:MAG: hypothetical protein J0H01_27850 [Rhizobiales bacterium]|nr:hypothetical protein [Hyphomicrobiales bacterium]